MAQYDTIEFQDLLYYLLPQNHMNSAHLLLSMVRSHGEDTGFVQSLWLPKDLGSYYFSSFDLLTLYRLMQHTKFEYIHRTRVLRNIKRNRVVLDDVLSRTTEYTSNIWMSNIRKCSRFDVYTLHRLNRIP